MEVNRSSQGPLAILSVRGPIIEEEMEPLERSFREALNAGHQKMILDLLEVPFVDSHALERVHFMINTLTEHGGNLCISGLNDVCRDIFRVTRMDVFAQTAENRESAARMLV